MSSDMYRNAPGDRALAEPPPEDLVQVRPVYEVVCRLCGPLDCGIHSDPEGAERDRAAHLASHAAGHYRDQL